MVSNLKRNLLYVALAAFVAGIMFTGGCLLANRISLETGGAKGESFAMAANAPAAGEEAVADIVDRSGGAVVKIDTYSKQTATDPFFNDPFFRQFFGNPYRSVPKEVHGLGSGFVTSADGYILTNEHVIDGASRITVTIQGFDKPLEARVAGSDYDLDLAVLKVDAGRDLPVLTMGDSDSTKVGNWVIAIGNPYGLDHTVTVGVISAKGRPVQIENRGYKNLLQTDASINPGNSGGPLLNMAGQVIGINTAVAQAQGIGFAIPANTAKEVLSDLINNGKVTRPWLGVQLQSLTQDAAATLGLQNTRGALVAGVISGSPAQKAGLKQGDVIVSWDGKQVAGVDELVTMIQQTKIGQIVQAVLSREGKSITVKVLVTEKPAG